MKSNQNTSMLFGWTALLLSALVVGCGGPFQLAPVSGVVKLDGKPLEGAMVRFQPQRVGDDPVLGPASIGVTDSEGQFTLRTNTKESGAVVGPHVVSVSTFDQRLVDPANSDQVEVVAKEVVPQKYRSPSELSFDVPRGGGEANFDLVSK